MNPFWRATLVKPDIDAQGNLYIADTGNSAVRRVTPQGTITTASPQPADVTSDPTPSPLSSMCD